ncbi:MAG: carboxypeptidase regulatory-like domain-containing protein [Candidatus Rokubacteria bacterium]|nr:carboxypeptidase regulatory-like domain-containing protein [Candidatus Rokubacteria bacterium]
MSRYFVWVISGLVCATVIWAMGAGTAGGGSVKGTVRLAGAPVKPKKVPVTIDQYVCGKEKEAEDVVLSPDNGIRYAVVSLQSPPPGAKWNAPLPPAQIDQKQCMFVPRVVVVPAGGIVEFLNSDRLLHNVKSFSKVNSPFNKAHPKARTISVVFKEPEIIRIECDLHSWMRSWVVVAGHPFYAVTNDKGEFALDNVPPGKYTLQIWQESLGTVTRDVTVGDTSAATVTVEMTRK